MGQLNDLLIKSSKPRDKEYLLADGEGLYLRIRLTSKVWVYRYKNAGKEAKLSLGPYPALPLAAARKMARAEAEKRAAGVDPRLARREEAERSRVARLNTFELTARAWIAQAHKDRQWSDGYAAKVTRHLELHIFPWIGGHAMEAVAPTELVRCLHRIKDRGHLETAQRVREGVLPGFSERRQRRFGCPVFGMMDKRHHRSHNDNRKRERNADAKKRGDEQLDPLDMTIGAWRF